MLIDGVHKFHNESLLSVHLEEPAMCLHMSIPPTTCTALTSIHIHFNSLTQSSSHLNGFCACTQHPYMHFGTAWAQESFVLQTYSPPPPPPPPPPKERTEIKFIECFTSTQITVHLCMRHAISADLIIQKVVFFSTLEHEHSHSSADLANACVVCMT